MGQRAGTVLLARARVARARGADSAQEGLTAQARSIRMEIESLLSEIRVESGAGQAGAAEGTVAASTASAAYGRAVESEVALDDLQAPGPPVGQAFSADAEVMSTASSVFGDQVSAAPAPPPASWGAGIPSPSPVPVQAREPVADPQPASPPSDIQRGTSKVVVVSAGYNSGDIADFFLDEQLVPIIGPEGRRGLNIVVIDPQTTQIVSARTYDVWGDAGGQSKALASDLEALPKGHIVLAALKDSGMENLSMDAIDALAGVGSTIDGPLDFRQSYALIGVKGGTALAERTSTKMLLIDTVLPFAVGSSSRERPGGGVADDALGAAESTWEEALHILEQVGRPRSG